MWYRCVLRLPFFSDAFWLYQAKAGVLFCLPQAAHGYVRTILSSMLRAVLLLARDREF
jgi:hypothetical protein